MTLRTIRLPLLAICSLAGISLSGEDGKLWIFEGLITQADPALAPELQSGWVLAGSFFFSPMEMEEEPFQGSIRSGRLAGGIHDAELTIDLYYQLQFEAFQSDGLAGLDYTDNDPDANGRDLFGWFIPMRGRLKETEWTSRWLQVWLADAEGKMIRSMPPRFSPYGMEWETGWFRLTLENESGDTTTVDGRIEVFSPADQLPQEDEETRWHGIAIELSELLKQRDLAVGSLQDDLAKARARLDGLQKMVDLMVEERVHLQEENSLLQDQAKLADPAVLETVAELTTRKAFLEEEIATLKGESEMLEQQLAKSDQDRSLLKQRIRELEQELEQAAIGETDPASEDLKPVAERPFVIVEAWGPDEEPVVVSETPSPAPAKRVINPPPTAKSSSASSWRRGPRKFR